MNSNRILSCEEANNVDMVEYFSKLGLEPKRVSGHQYWYLSPFRNERTASFKINRKINCWYDFGEGKGGTMVDFGIRHFQCSVYDFLQMLFLSPAPASITLKNDNKPEKKEAVIEILNVKSISSLSLLNYLKERKIDKDIASSFCKEISFRINDNNYFAIGFANDSGGYELRNSLFKGSTTPKDITTIKNGATKVNLFEGFFDFLSYQSMMQKSVCVNEDYCILNSLSFLEKGKDVLTHYQTAGIFFDRDTSGIRASEELQQSNKGAKDESNLYNNHKDLNEWLVHFGLSSKQNTRDSIRERL